MLTKELKLEALKKSFQYKNVQASVETYATKNMRVFDFVGKNTVVARICIAERYAGIYDVESKQWIGTLTDTYISDKKYQFYGYKVSEKMQKMLGLNGNRFDQSVVDAIDHQMRQANNYLKFKLRNDRLKETRKNAAGTNKKIPDGFKIFNRKLIEPSLRMVYSADEEAVFCSKCRTTTPMCKPKRGTTLTCPSCGFSAKSSVAKNPIEDVQWSYIVQSAGKRCVIRYFCNVLWLKYGECDYTSTEKFRTIIEEDGHTIELMKVVGNDYWEDYKEKNYNYMCPAPKTELPYNMHFYGTVNAVMKMPALKNSMLDVWVKEHLQKDRSLSDYFLIERYIKIYHKTDILEKLLKCGLERIADEYVYSYSYVYTSLREKNAAQIWDLFDLKRGDLKRLRSVIKDPSYSDVSAMHLLVQNNLHLSDDELKTYLTASLPNHIREKAVKHCKERKVTFYKLYKYVTEKADNQWTSYFDYIEWSEKLGLKKSDSLYYPKKFMEQHDRLHRELEEKENADKILETRKNSKKIAMLWEKRMQIPQYHYENESLLVMMPHGISDLKKEGKRLNHCVGRYGDSVANEKTQIFFIRKKNNPRESFYTLEIKNDEIIQCHTKNNVDMTDEIRAFAQGFLTQLKTITPTPAVVKAAA